MNNVIVAFRCTECAEIQKDDYGPVYECGNCDNRFAREDTGSHKCECGKFASKLADHSIECGCNAEAEEVMAYQCEACQELVHEDDAKEHQCNDASAGQSMSSPYLVGEVVKSHGVLHSKPDKSACLANVEVVAVGEHKLAVRCIDHPDKMTEISKYSVTRVDLATSRKEE